MSTKAFSETLYAANDAATRSTVKEYFEGYAIDNPDKYGIDLIAQNLGIEVERRPLWKGKKFPFDTVNFLARKAKFFSGDSLTVYFIVNDDYSVGMFCMGTDIQKFVLNNTPVEQSCRVEGQYRTESVYKLPISFFHYVFFKHSQTQPL